MPQKNQHKPCREYLIFLAYVSQLNNLIFLAPDEDIRQPLEEYFKLGCSDVETTELLKFHYDTASYGLRYGYQIPFTAYKPITLV
jgi:hypothetical protein